MPVQRKNVFRLALIGLVLFAMGGLLLRDQKNQDDQQAGKDGRAHIAPMVQGVDTSSSSSGGLSHSDYSTNTKVAGLSVQMSPRTGELFPPTIAQKQALAQALRDQFSKKPESVFIRDRTLSFVVSPRQLNFSLARMNAQGELVVDCVNGVEHAAGLLEKLPVDVGHSSRGVEE